MKHYTVQNIMVKIDLLIMMTANKIQHLQETIILSLAGAFIMFY